MSLIQLTAAELLRGMQQSEFSSVEVTQAFLDQIQLRDQSLHSFLEVRREHALREAAEVDRKRSQGTELGLLAGLPVAVKDVICMAGEATTCGSKMLREFAPPYNATVIDKLRAADAVILGKTNLDEFAMGSSTENSAYQITRNPWDLSRIPGGSSGGAAACVAASLAPLSLGTDTGGSIRQPAALCGVVGMKPTYGRVSRFGLVAFASSLDQIGPLARTAEDTAMLLQAISGHDPSDSTSAHIETPRYVDSVKEPLANLKIGLVKEHFGDGLDSEIAKSVQEAIKVYESLGATITEVSLPHSKYAIATYYVIAPSEASSNLARYDGVHYGFRADEQAILDELKAEQEALAAAGDEAAADALETPLVRMYRATRAAGFGTEVKRRIMLGTYALSAGYYDAYYLKALKVRRLIRNDYDAAFQKVDLIAGPTTPSPAFRLGEKSNDPLSMYLEDLYTVSANLAGIGGISLPCGFTNARLPIGLQLQAPAFSEERLLRAAFMFQQATDWHQHLPEPISPVDSNSEN